MYVKVWASGQAEVSPSPALNKSSGLWPLLGLARAGLFRANLRAGLGPARSMPTPTRSSTVIIHKVDKIFESIQ